jgi:hypothetical protein
VTRDGVSCRSCEGAAVCGDGRCEGGESPEGCPQDCGARCAPDQERCNGDARERCDLQGRWELLACPPGEACALRDGAVVCEADLVVNNDNPNNDPNNDPNNGSPPLDGRILGGEAPWPGTGGAAPWPVAPAALRQRLTPALSGPVGAEYPPGSLRLTALVGEDELELFYLTGSVRWRLDGQPAWASAGEVSPEAHCAAYEVCHGVYPAGFPVEPDLAGACAAAWERAVADPDPARAACEVETGFNDCLTRATLYRCGLSFLRSPPAALGAAYGLSPRVAGPGSRIVARVPPEGWEPPSPYVDRDPPPTAQLALLDRAAGEVWVSPALGSGYLFGAEFVVSEEGDVVIAEAWREGASVLVRWRPGEGELAVGFPSGERQAPRAISPNGALLAIAGAWAPPGMPSLTALALWDFEREARVFSILSRSPQEDFGGRGARFSPTGGVLAVLVNGVDSASRAQGGRIELWDLERRALQHTLEPGADAVLVALAWRPDGGAVAAAVARGGSGEVIVWDANTGQRLQSWALEGPMGDTAALHYSRSGEVLLLGSEGSPGPLAVFTP